MKKILQITSKEKIALIVVFLLVLFSNLMAKILRIGENNNYLSFHLFRDITGINVFLIESGFLVISYVVWRSFLFNKVSRVGFILLIGGLLTTVVWRIIFGGILEWIDLFNFPMFNLSELSMLVGVVLIFIGSIWDGIQ